MLPGRKAAILKGESRKGNESDKAKNHRIKAKTAKMVGETTVE
jgi:hypothetical protein